MTSQKSRLVLGPMTEPRFACRIRLLVLAVSVLAVAPPVVAEVGSQAETGAGGPVGDTAIGLNALAGERLEYRVRWGMLSVARAVLEVEAAAEGFVVLRATAQTRGWIDPVYPVRDLVESTVAAAELRPLRFRKRTKEGHGRPEVVEVEFDEMAGLARYVKNGEARQPLPLPAGFQDPLSCIYAYRVSAADAAGEVGLEVTDGKRVVAGAFREVGRERVRTPAGEFDAVIVEPTIEGLGGVFRRSKKAKLRIWFTDDVWRRPVRFYSEVAVGSFTMELTGMKLTGVEDGGAE